MKEELKIYLKKYNIFILMLKYFYDQDLQINKTLKQSVKELNEEVCYLKNQITNLTFENISLKAENENYEDLLKNKKVFSVYEKNNILYLNNGKRKINVMNPNYRKNKSDLCGICSIKRPIYNKHCGVSVCIKCYLDPINIECYGDKCLICKYQI